MLSLVAAGERGPAVTANSGGDAATSEPGQGETADENTAPSGAAGLDGSEHEWVEEPEGDDGGAGSWANFRFLWCLSGSAVVSDWCQLNGWKRG
jgi:hypothetical protein